MTSDLVETRCCAAKHVIGDVVFNYVHAHSVVSGLYFPYEFRSESANVTRWGLQDELKDYAASFVS